MEDFTQIQCKDGNTISKAISIPILTVYDINDWIGKIVDTYNNFIKITVCSAEYKESNLQKASEPYQDHNDVADISIEYYDENNDTNCYIRYYFVDFFDSISLSKIRESLFDLMSNYVSSEYYDIENVKTVNNNVSKAIMFNIIKKKEKENNNVEIEVYL